MAKEKPSEVKYIGIRNPSMVQLTMRKISKLYTKYAQMVLDIKKLRDSRRKKKAEYIEKVKVLNKEFEGLVGMVPRVQIQKIAPPPKPKAVETEIEHGARAVSSFDDLRFEFERLRKELEKI